MAWIIGFAVVLGFICLASEWEYDPVEAFFFGAFGSILGGIVGFLVAMFIGLFAYSGTHDVSETHKLESIQDNSTVHGSFFLGIGTVDGNPTYSWYEETGPNTFERMDVDASSGRVHYVAADESPHYVVTYEKSDSGFWHTWGVNVDSGNHEYATGYDFYVPKGTITHDFKLDAQG